jgi:hypothetical protein
MRKGSPELLPFVVSNHVQIATAFAIAVAVSVVVESVFKPRENWQLYSEATDRLAIAELKLQGLYDQYKELLDVLLATERRKMERLTGLKELLAEVDKIAPNALTGLHSTPTRAEPCSRSTSTQLSPTPALLQLSPASDQNQRSISSA